MAKILGQAISPPSPPPAPAAIPATPATQPTAVTAPRTPDPIVTDIPAVAPPRVPNKLPSPPDQRPILRDTTNLPAPVSAARVPRFQPLSKETPNKGSMIRLRSSPRLKQLYSRLNSHRSTHLAQSVQHDPTIAGKMFDPDTGRAETIDTLLDGPEILTWTTSLSNEWGRCTRGL